MNFLAESEYSQAVSAESLERELQRVRASTTEAAKGVFGPRSLTWQIDRESAIFFGAGRALLLQLAHPWVAAAIEKHSDAFADPVGRFHRTLSSVSLPMIRCLTAANRAWSRRWLNPVRDRPLSILVYDRFAVDCGPFNLPPWPSRTSSAVVGETVVDALAAVTGRAQTN
jgi:mpaB/rubber oxygenase-like protein